MQRLDSTGYCSSHDDSSCSGEEWDRGSEDSEAGVILEVAIPDMRLETEAGHCSRTVLSVSPLGEAGSVFTLRLATSHHSFSLKRSVATRSTEDFYQLQSWLSGHTGHYPRLSVPSLPPRLMMTVFSRPRQAAVLARFTHELLSTREYLSSKALHLFLQTGLSIQRISLNIQGLRDDDVPSYPLVDKRNNSRNGFSQIFGDL